MLDLLADDDARGFGLASALGLAGLSFRRIARADDGHATLVVARPLRGDEHAAVQARPAAVVVGPLEAGEPTAHAAPAHLDLTAPIWPARVRRLAARHAVGALVLPAADVVAGRGVAGEVLAALQRPPDAPLPAVARAGRVVRSFLDVGAALTALLADAHAPAPVRRTVQGPVARAALAAYYRAPASLRSLAQRRGYAGLERRIAALGPRASTYPVDATGWLLVELVAALVRAASGPLLRLAPWPTPFTSAAALTHDVEPTRFAYGRGLELLAERVRRTRHPATLGLVAAPATRWLPSELPAIVRTAGICCHGLEHRGETLAGSRADVLDGLRRARTTLAARVGRPIEGFRSPRLDRAPDLLWALDQAGFAWDSSYPDVDRENVDLAGGGVRLCAPYRPPIADGDRVRASRCLELPVSAPDCIQPLFQHDDLGGLRRAVRAKTAFVRDTGGLYVGIVHAGVFDERDARRRGAHLAFVHRLVARPDVWNASAGDIAGWWRAREQVAVGVTGDGTAVVENRGDASITGLALTLEEDESDVTLPLPPIDAGGRVTVRLHASPSRPAEVSS